VICTKALDEQASWAYVRVRKRKAMVKNDRRIMIFGRPGSGKSTFALKLHHATGIPIHHLDKHFFKANWVERDYEEFLAIQRNLIQQNTWIIDGNMTKSLEMRFSRANMVLYFNFPRPICYWRILKRSLNRNAAIDDRAVGCGDKITWSLLKYTWGFEQRVAQKIAEFKLNHPDVRFVEIRSDLELKRIDNELSISC